MAALTTHEPHHQYDPAAYATRVLHITNNIMSTNDSPPPCVHGVAWRTSLLACMPLICAPCCLWSLCCRFVACPYVCLRKGSRSICSNNCCTDPTDSVIQKYAGNINRRDDDILPRFAPCDYSPQLLDAITVVESHFRMSGGASASLSCFTLKHSLLNVAVVLPLCCPENCMNPGCGNALALLAALRARLADLS